MVPTRSDRTDGPISRLQHQLAQHDRVEVDTVGLDATLDKFIAAGTKAREAGDQGGVQSVLTAIDRIRDGESVEMVYLEWLRAQQPEGGDCGDAGR